MFHRTPAAETALLILAVCSVLHSRSELSSCCVARLQWVDGFRAKTAMQPTGLLPIQTKDTKSLGAGKLLVASRDLGDPRFTETVILLVQYDAQGVVGLILNRRTNMPLSRALEDLKAAKDRSDPIYLGGPVETPVVLALYQAPAKIEGAEHVFGGVYLISAKTLFEQVISARPDPGIFHVYLGYAGWTKDQLRKEVELGAWFIFPPDAGAVFNSDPDSLWLEMIRKTELQLARKGRRHALPSIRGDYPDGFSRINIACAIKRPFSPSSQVESVDCSRSALRYAVLR